MAVYGITRVRNESVIITETLDHFAKICTGGILVYDDRSSDATAELCRSHPAVLEVIQGLAWDTNRERAEFENRQAVFQACCMRAQKNDWIVYFDADERFEFDPNILEDGTVDALRMRLFDFYITEEDKDLHYTERKYIGPEYRDILMAFRKRVAKGYSRNDQRECTLKWNARVIQTGYVRHYGKSISIAQWESTCEYYATHFPKYSSKWEKRKGKAIHTKSDFGAELITWEEKDTRGYRLSPDQGLFRLLRRLWNHIPSRRRRMLGLLLVLMVVASFAETLSIGAVLPFLGVLTAPGKVFRHPAAQSFVAFFGIRSPEALLLPLTLLFGMAALAAGALRLLLLWASTRLSFAVGADLSADIYRRTLYQPYATHLARNSSEIIDGISGKANSVIFNVIVPAMNILSTSILLLGILAALLAIEPAVAIGSFGGFGLIYLGINWITRNELYANSQCVAKKSTQVIKALREGLGGIRDILIDGSQNAYCRVYQASDFPLRRAQGTNLFISQSPRFAIEALGMVFIAGMAYALAKHSSDIAVAIPVLGALALGAQRLLPAMQQAYAGWSSIQGAHASLRDTLELLGQPLPTEAYLPPPTPMPFECGIRLRNLSFRYSSQSPLILENLDLSIPKGSRIGIIGLTGSGKSTLLDLVMGLLRPTEGTLEIDGQTVETANQRAWQTHIAHVPQTIFLADSTIEENIAFGVPKDLIDRKRVEEAARQAQLAETIEAWPRKYQTSVGERGVRISGGQRQRIGIARALYKHTNVIVLDEATSALDNETEKSVMAAIDALSPDLTLLIIAHRLTTLSTCTRVIELGHGRIVRSGSYLDIVGQTTRAGE